MLHDYEWRSRKTLCSLVLKADEAYTELWESAGDRDPIQGSNAATVYRQQAFNATHKIWHHKAACKAESYTDTET